MLFFENKLFNQSSRTPFWVFRSIDTPINMIKSRLLQLVFGFFVLLTASCNLLRERGQPDEGSNPAPASLQLRRNIVQAAQKHVGAPYQYAGTSPSTGFDCSGFTSFVLKDFRIKASPASSQQAREGRPVDLARVQPADLIFFGEGKRIQHVAMVVKRGKDGLVCVHSTTSRGVVVENVSTSKYWKPLILFARDVVSK
jgi:cell wall-associated NlpC family hydrolase